MAFTKKQTTTRVYFDLAGYEATVKNVHVLSETVVSFVLSCHGFALYNMRLIQKTDGGFFIAPPSHKGKDGKYYGEYAVYLTEEDEQRLIDKVLELVENV